MSYEFKYDTYEDVPIGELAKLLSRLDTEGFKHEHFYNPAKNTFIVLASRRTFH